MQGPTFGGLSPLTRGNLADSSSASLCPGPIPAHAGQPRRRDPGRGAARAYPRSRGATHASRQRGQLQMGLSPLTRGNLQRVHVRRSGGGPIPAHAGQPRAASSRSSGSGAYPRSRGATSSQAGSGHGSGGLSPLTRGNLGLATTCRPAAGPIPAHAGQPLFQRRGRYGPGAYPRSRGATLPVKMAPWSRRGLSPLTRGNPGRG